MSDLLPAHRVRGPLYLPLLALSLLLFAVAVPSGLFLRMAYVERARALEAGEITAQRTVRALHEHALRALETNELLLRDLDAQLSGRTWSEIRSDGALQRRLRHLAEASEAIANLALVDATGQVRESSGPSQGSPVNVAERDYFAMLRDGRELAIGAPLMSQLSGEAVFPLAIRRSAADGAFDGALVVGIPLRYLTAFWQQFAPDLAHVVPLMRDDGQLIARYPAAQKATRLDPNAPFMREIARADQGLYTAVSRLDGVERMNAWTRIAGYPLYVSFSIETRAILAQWRATLAPYVGLTIVAVVVLLVLGGVLIRRVHREQQALQCSRAAARRLEHEMARRQAAEETLRQAQKMEAIGHITGGVAHDFNNLLQALSNNLQIALRMTAPEAPSRRFMDAGLQAVDRGAKLTRQLLAFSRRQPLEARPLRIDAMLNEMAGLLRSTVGGTVQLRIDVNADAGLAMADRTQAEMAVLNLVVNARDAMPEGGVISVAAGRREVDGDAAEALRMQPGEYEAITVADSGCGMPPEVLRRAFEPFFTTKAMGKGSGLGLSQVHGFAAQSGGGVRITSRVGEGTHVCLLLPRAAADARAEPEPVAAPSQVRAEGTLVLVDDDPDVREATAAGLAALGYRVITARGGEEAMELLTRHPEAAGLITDYAMPGMLGSELARLARARWPALGILMVTGFADLPDRVSAELDVMRKPFGPEDLALRVARAISRASRRLPATAGA